MVLPSNTVFISYRKDDSAGWSAKLADGLRTTLGDGAVFIDDSSGIPYGTQWPNKISVALNQCRVFLPVIAPSWHQATNLNRLKESNDWVRKELLTTHGRRSSVLCIPVFVNEAQIFNAKQFSDDLELQKAIVDLMTDQGIRLDRSTEHWPAKIDSLISRIESHLDVTIRRPDSRFTAMDTKHVDPSVKLHSPVIQWLHANSGWIGAIGAIVGIVAVIPAFMGSSSDDNGDVVHVEGDVQGGLFAGRDINNIFSNPQDGESITTLIQVTAAQQKTIDKLLSQLSAEDQESNEQIPAQITDAVVAIQGIGADASQIEEAEAALAQGDTALAQALYKADAENKAAAGEAQLREAAASYRRLGALAFLGDTTAALEAYENAVEAWPADTRSWNQLGHLYRRMGQLDQAIEAYGQISVLVGPNDEPQGWKAISLGNQGLVHQARGELGQAVEMFEQSLAISMELGSKAGMASAYGNLGSVHRVRGELDQAVQMYEKSLALNTELGRKAGIATQYANLGLVYQTHGELDQAVEMFEKSLTLNIELGSKEGMAIDYSNLGVVHQTRDELDQAVQMYEKSLALNTEMGRKIGIATQYGNLGIVHGIRGELDQSVEMLEKSLALNTELGSKAGMASVYGNLGAVHQMRGELDQAVQMYEKALALNTELGSKSGMAIQYANLGLVHQKRGELDQTRKSWEQAVKLFDLINSPNAEKVSSWIRELGAN